MSTEAIELSVKNGFFNAVLCTVDPEDVTETPPDSTGDWIGGSRSKGSRSVGSQGTTRASSQPAMARIKDSDCGFETDEKLTFYFDLGVGQVPGEQGEGEISSGEESADLSVVPPPRGSPGSRLPPLQLKRIEQPPHHDQWGDDFADQLHLDLEARRDSTSMVMTPEPSPRPQWEPVQQRPVVTTVIGLPGRPDGQPTSVTIDQNGKPLPPGAMPGAPLKFVSNLADGQSLAERDGRIYQVLPCTVYMPEGSGGYDDFSSLPPLLTLLAPSMDPGFIVQPNTQPSQNLASPAAAAAAAAAAASVPVPPFPAWGCPTAAAPAWSSPPGSRATDASQVWEAAPQVWEIASRKLRSTNREAVHRFGFGDKDWLFSLAMKPTATSDDKGGASFRYNEQNGGQCKFFLKCLEDLSSFNINAHITYRIILGGRPLKQVTHDFSMNAVSELPEDVLVERYVKGDTLTISLEIMRVGCFQYQ